MKNYKKYIGCLSLSVLTLIGCEDLKFGEKFLEVSFTPSNDSCDFSYHSISELMLLFTKERVEEEEVKFNLLLESDSCREQSDQSWFQLKGTQSSPQIISYMNGVEICSSQEGCWYEDAGFGDQDGLEKMDMRNAFWNAYMSSVVKSLFSVQDVFFGEGTVVISVF